MKAAAHKLINGRSEEYANRIIKNYWQLEPESQAEIKTRIESTWAKPHYDYECEDCGADFEDTGQLWFHQTFVCDHKQKAEK